MPRSEDLAQCVTEDPGDVAAVGRPKRALMSLVDDDLSHSNLLLKTKMESGSVRPLAASLQRSGSHAAASSSRTRSSVVSSHRDHVGSSTANISSCVRSTVNRPDGSSCRGALRRLSLSRLLIRSSLSRCECRVSRWRSAVSALPARCHLRENGRRSPPPVPLDRAAGSGRSRRG